MIKNKSFTSIYFYLSFLRVVLSFVVLIDLTLSIPVILEKDEFFYNNFSSLRMDGLEEFIPYFIFLYSFFLLLFLMGIGKGMVALVLFFFSFIFYLVFNSTFSGATTISATTFLFLIPVDSFRYFSIKPSKSFSNLLDKSFHNIGVAFLYFHINYIFFSTALNKLTNESWLSGNGVIHGVLYYNFDVFHTMDYLFLLSENFLILFGYFILFLQFFFPILMMNKNTRWFAFFSIIFAHLGIALAMFLIKFQAIVFLLLPIVLFKNQIFRELKKLYSE